MADKYFSDPCYGSFGYIPDKPIVVNAGIGYSVVVSAQAVPTVSADFGIAYGFEVDAVEHANTFDIGIEYGMSATVAQLGSIEANIGISFGIDTTLTAPQPIVCNVGINYGVEVNALQHGMSADFGIYYGVEMSMVNLPEMEASFGIGYGFVANMRSTVSGQCAIPSHSSSRWV